MGEIIADCDYLGRTNLLATVIKGAFFVNQPVSYLLAQDNQGIEQLGSYLKTCAGSPMGSPTCLLSLTLPLSQRERGLLR